MLNYLFGKPTGIEDLEKLIQQLEAINEKMLSRSQSSSALGNSIYSLVKSEAPTFAVYFERVKEIYDNLSINYKLANQEQARAIEDLKDIIIRYPILQKLEKERDELKKVYDEGNKKYKEAKANLKAEDTPDNLNKYRNLRIERANLASKLIEKSEEYIDYRNRFNKFTANRSVDCWSRYGKSIERAAKEEAGLMAKLTDLCRSLRDNVNSPTTILERIESSAKDFIIDEDEINIMQRSNNHVDSFEIITDSNIPIPKDILDSDSNKSSDGYQVPPDLELPED